METLICEKPTRIIKNKKRLEEELEVKITGKGKEITVQGSPEKEYFADKVISALEFGFPLNVALLIKNEENMLEVLNLKNYTHKRDFERIRARLIGTKGKTLRTLNELTKCHFEVSGNQVGIIGDPEYIKNAQEAVISIVRGAKHANVYAFLEKHQVQPVFDLGLKSVKKPKSKK